MIDKELVSGHIEDLSGVIKASESTICTILDRGQLMGHDHAEIARCREFVESAVIKQHEYGKLLSKLDKGVEVSVEEFFKAKFAVVC